jgi:hypothetical protein
MVARIFAQTIEQQAVIPEWYYRESRVADSFMKKATGFPLSRE